MKRKAVSNSMNYVASAHSPAHRPHRFDEAVDWAVAATAPLAAPAPYARRTVNADVCRLAGLADSA